MSDPFVRCEFVDCFSSLLLCCGSFGGRATVTLTARLFFFPSSKKLKFEMVLFRIRPLLSQLCRIEQVVNNRFVSVQVGSYLRLGLNVASLIGISGQRAERYL